MSVCGHTPSVCPCGAQLYPSVALIACGGRFVCLSGACLGMERHRRLLTVREGGRAQLRTCPAWVSRCRPLRVGLSCTVLCPGEHPHISLDDGRRSGFLLAARLTVSLSVYTCVTKWKKTRPSRTETRHNRPSPFSGAVCGHRARYLASYCPGQRPCSAFESSVARSRRKLALYNSDSGCTVFFSYANKKGGKFLPLLLVCTYTHRQTH